MHVILLERVEKLGTIGDVVNVKPGFARNFLLPRGKALRATEANKARFEQDRARIEADNAKRRDIARSESREIEGASVVMIQMNCRIATPSSSTKSSPTNRPE
jgi:large subunit ribosomal protein L9